MRSFSKYIFFTLAITLGCSSIGASESSAQDVINQILKRMEAHANALSSLKSNITMSQHDSVLDDYDVQKGTVKYLPGKGKNIYLRIDWTDPVEEVLIVAKGNYVLHRPRLKQAMTGKTSSANKGSRSGGSFDFMTMTKVQIKQNYSIVYLGVEKIGGKDMWHLVMNPKKKKSYKNVDLWVDGNGMPIQSRVNERNGDSTTVLLTNVDKNKTIKGKDFGIILPPGTKRIKG